jgi:hypothetical protein
MPRLEAKTTRLTRGSKWVEIVSAARFVVITKGGGRGKPEVEQTLCWNEEAARSSAEDLVKERLAKGWKIAAVPPARMRARKSPAGRKHEALAAQPDPRAALREFAGDIFSVSKKAASTFEKILARVDAIASPGDDGFDVSFKNGASLTWSVAKRPSKEKPRSVALVRDRLAGLWLYLTPERRSRSDHNLYFGAGAGPPEPDFELEKTKFAGVRVTWFLQELPWDRYWFVTPDEPESARCYEFDGGLHKKVTRGPIAQLLASRILELVQRED